MAKKVQEIQAKLTGDNSDLIGALNDAGKKIKKTAQDAEKQASAVGKKMNDAFAGIGTWAVDKGVEKFGEAIEHIKAQMEAMAEIGKGAQAAGLDPVLFQQLTKTAEASGYSFEEARTRFETFESVLMAARAGNEKANLQLQAIGTLVDKLQGLSPWEAFTKAIPEAENLQRHLSAIFGEQAAGNEGFKRFLDVAKTSSHSVFNEQAIQNAVKYQQAIEKLNGTVMNFITESGLIGWITESIDKLNSLYADMEPEHNEIVSEQATDARRKQTALISRTRYRLIQEGQALLANGTPEQLAEFMMQYGREFADAYDMDPKEVARRLKVAEDTIQEINERNSARRKAKTKAQAEELNPADSAVRQLHQLEQAEEAAAIKAKADEARVMRRMNPAQRLEFLRTRAVDELMKQSPELSRADAASTILREEASSLAQGKYPQRWTDAGAKTKAPMDAAAQALLKAADRIDRDGFYVKRKN